MVKISGLGNLNGDLNLSGNKNKVEILFHFTCQKDKNLEYSAFYIIIIRINLTEIKIQYDF